MRLLDGYCGAGGAAKGYADAGFEIVGIDNRPQPNYPYPFIQMDFLEAVDRLIAGEGLLASDGRTYYLSDFDAIHASPPCQAYSIMRNLPWLRDKEYPRLIEPTRERLEASGAAWVIENVEHARRSTKRPDGMQAGFLCGLMFGLPIYRHRLFESSFFWLQPAHPRHQFTIRGSRTLGGRARDVVFSSAEDSRGMKSWPGRRGEAGHGLSPAKRPNYGFDKPGANIGHSGRGVARVREAMEIDWMLADELSQAVPPAFTEYIGTRLMEYLR